MKETLNVERERLRKRVMARVVCWAGLALLLLAFALRIHGLGGRELTFDEVASFFIANRGPIGLLTYVRGAVREHPPLYYMVLSLWMPLVGRTEFAIRYLSVVIGIMTVAATYRVLKKATNPRLAFLSMLLLAISPFHIGISRDARMYGLLTLWTVVSVSAFIRILGREDERGRSSPPHFLAPLFDGTEVPRALSTEALAGWGLFWLATGLGMFTHYFMMFVLLAQDLYLVLRWRRYRHLMPFWLAIHVALGGLAALWTVLSPGLWATLMSVWSRGMASTVRWQALTRALNGLYLGATARPNWSHLGPYLILTALGVLPFIWRESSSVPRSGWKRLLLGLLLGVPIAAVLAMPERVSGRYLTPALPASIVAMAAGLQGVFVFLTERVFVEWDEHLRKLAAGLFLFVLLGTIFFIDVQAYSSIYSPSGESFRNKTDYLDAHARPEDGLLLHGPWQSLLLSYYDVESLSSYTMPLRDLRTNADQVDGALKQMLATHRRLWVSYDSVEPVDPDQMVARWLHENAHQVLDDQGLTLYYRSPGRDLPVGFGAHRAGGDESEPAEGDTRLPLPSAGLERDGYEDITHPDVAFGEKVRLDGEALANTDLTSGEAVLLLSQWRVLRDISSGLMLRLELVGPGGQVWGHYQFDTGPALVASKARSAGDTFTERRGLVVPTGTPPGRYRLRMRVMSREGEEWLPPGDEPYVVGLVRVRHHEPPSNVIQALPGQDLRAAFDGRISLIGYAPWGYDFTQGNPLLFDIYWQALKNPVEDYELVVEVAGVRGAILVKKRVQPIAAWVPTSAWKARDVLKGHYAIHLPADAQPGSYQVRLSVVAPDGSPLTVSGARTRRIFDGLEREETLSGKDLTLFEGRIEPRSRRYSQPAIDHRIDVVLGASEDQQSVRLLGYDLAPSVVEPGGAFELTLYWKALSRMERIYAVFNHVVAPGGTVLAQQDGWPREGTYHTSQWLPGEIVEDHYTLQIPVDAPPGQYSLRVGMYDAASKERLLVTVAGNSSPEGYVQLTTVTVGR